MSYNSTPEAELVLSRLDQVRQSGKAFSALCPAHADSSPSLRVSPNDETHPGVALFCNAGCKPQDIVAALGLEMKDLFDNSKNEKRELVATYKYYDEDGEFLFEKQKFITPSGKKTFSQRRRDPDTGEWIYNLDGVDKVLYNLPKVLAAVREGKKIAVVEGEKDAEAIMEEGFVATTMPGGAGKWDEIHTAALAGARVTVIQDNDSIGQEHALDVISKLKAAGCEVTHRKPPEPFKDVAEMLGAGKSLSALVEVIPDPLDVFIEQVREIQSRPISNERKMIHVQRLIDTSTDTDYSPTLGVAPYNWERWLQKNQNDSYDWIIKDLIERMERIICVAAEGAGKSFLMRQVAILSAAGMHPFTYGRIDPLVTLSIDLENPDRILQRTSRRIMDMARERTWMSSSADINAFIKPLPGGMNLFDARARKEVEAWVADLRPDILFFGPLYKSYIEQSGRSEQSMATELAMFFDYLRYEYNCALWMEQHAPLGNSITGRDLRPFGSSVWSRWPEFGMSMSLDPLKKGAYKISWFRGSRDERSWPEEMHRGRIGVDFPFVVDKFREIEKWG